MLRNQMFVELRRSCTVKNLLIWLIILMMPFITFYSIKTGYRFNGPVDLFQEMIGQFIPLLFPVFIIVIYLPSFLEEQKYSFITYTRPRVPIQTYILSKGLTNALLTSGIIFLMVFLAFIFAMYIEPMLGIIAYQPLRPGEVTSGVTFSQFLSAGNFTYGFVYSLWVSVNALLYSTIAFMLMLIIRSQFIALSIPFLFYHVFNFVTAIIGEPRFSPISTVFPFNIIQQPLWTVLIPFSFLLAVLIGLVIYVIRSQEEWVI